MSGARDHLDRRAERSGQATPRPVGRTPAPAIAGPGDPRLDHGGAGAADDMLQLQRMVGNAAVTSLVGTPAVQRVVAIDEVSTEVAPPEAQAPGTDAGVPTATGGPVTSDGGATTISGATINLAAPVTQADGIIRADTIIANSVVASSYTPGAGNEW
jgi:hypothetical protein